MNSLLDKDTEMSEAGTRKGPQRGLGRGLSALLGEADPATLVSGEGPRPGGLEVPIEHLSPNPDQPRRLFSETDIAELAASIREKGVLQPLLVRLQPGQTGHYQIVAGERRWRAAQMAGVRALPVVVREFNDLEVLEIGVIENVQRADLTPLEEAAAYRTLAEKFGRTQDEIAKTVGKSRSHVANAVRLLSLPEAVLAALETGQITAGHARAIATAPDPARLVARIVERGLSVREAEALSRADLKASGDGSGDRSGPAPETKGFAGPPDGKDADTLALEQDLGESLGLDVQIEDRQGRGMIVIRYETLEQLDDLCRKLSAT